MDPILGTLIGTAVGTGLGLFGANEQNNSARADARRFNRYQREVYDYQVEEQERQYDYAVEGLEIAKRNNETNLQFQEANLIQRYDYGMGIRQYEYNQQVRAYDESVARALQQQEYNTMATKFALVDQDRLLHEQLIDLSFQRADTLLDYRKAGAGLGLKKRQAKAAAVTEAQSTRISGLKAKGAAMARGVGGRSAGKNIQGIVAETGARQAAIVDNLMFNLDNTALEFVALNNQFIADQVALDFSEDSAKLSDMATRNKIKLQGLQAAIQAAASIALKPEIAPPLPKPFALPRPEYQDVYEPTPPPEPMKKVPAQTNLFTAALGGAIQGAQLGSSIGSMLNQNPLPLPQLPAPGSQGMPS